MFLRVSAFFFSSRRRHTRSKRDWSSDVCSSDFEGTKTILLEAAYFDRQAVRKTVNDTGLRSEASTRFEKGIDPNRVKEAGVRACELLVQFANGKVAEGTAEVDKLDRSEHTVAMN